VFSISYNYVFLCEVCELVVGLKGQTK